MTTGDIIIIRWWIRVTCLGGFAFGMIRSVWEEGWTWWGFVSISGFAIVATYDRGNSAKDMLIGFRYLRIEPPRVGTIGSGVSRQPQLRKRQCRMISQETPKVGLPIVAEEPSAADPLPFRLDIRFPREQREHIVG